MYLKQLQTFSPINVNKLFDKHLYFNDRHIGLQMIACLNNLNNLNNINNLINLINLNNLNSLNNLNKLINFLDNVSLTSVYF